MGPLDGLKMGLITRKTKRFKLELSVPFTDVGIREKGKGR